LGVRCNELLARELEELQAMDFDLDLVGFSGEELTRLLDGDILPGLVDPDDIRRAP
jgi:hypothetical protein